MELIEAEQEIKKIMEFIAELALQGKGTFDWIRLQKSERKNDSGACLTVLTRADLIKVDL